MATTSRRNRRDTVPQPAAATQQEDERTPEQIEREQADAQWQALVERATAGDGAPQKQIKRAMALETERADVLKRIAANREYLRLMDRNDELDEDQGEFLEIFYPEKERGARRTEDEIEATRRARVVARKLSND